MSYSSTYLSQKSLPFGGDVGAAGSGFRGDLRSRSSPKCSAAMVNDDTMVKSRNEGALQWQISQRSLVRFSIIPSWVAMKMEMDGIF